MCCCGCFLRKREQLRHSLLRHPNSSKIYDLHTFPAYVMAVQMNIFLFILDSFYFADVLDIVFILKCIKMKYFEKTCEDVCDFLLSFVLASVFLPSYSVGVN